MTAQGTQQKEFSLKFNSEVGGIIQSDFTESSAVKINGVIQDNKLTAKLEFKANPNKLVQLDGEFKSATEIGGRYALEGSGAPGELDLTVVPSVGTEEQKVKLIA